MDVKTTNIHHHRSLSFCLIFFAVAFIAQPAFAANLSLGPFDQGVYSGQPPFNTTGNCLNDGDDCGNDDDRVRTADRIDFAWSIVADSISGGGRIDNVILEQTIVPGTGAVIFFDSIPTICLAPPQGTGGTNPVSTITKNPDGSETLLCNLGDMGNGEQKSFSMGVKPSATSANGSTFTTQQNVYGLDASGATIVPPASYTDPATYTISSTPAFDLYGNAQAIYDGYTTTRNIGNGPEKGFVFYWTAHVGADEQLAGKGIEALQNSYSFTPGLSATASDGVTPIINLRHQIFECVRNTSRWQKVVLGSLAVNSTIPDEQKVTDSGRCTISGDANSGYTFTVTDNDTSGERYPTRTTNGTSLDNGPFYVASFRLRVFVPFTEVDLGDGIPGNNQGQLYLTSCLSDFDPTGISGNSNYGSGFEPGYNGAAMPDGSRSNNCTGPRFVEITAKGGYNTRVISKSNDGGGVVYPPIVSGYRTGEGVVEPGIPFGHMVLFQNRGSLNLSNPMSCFMFDETTQKLVDKGEINATPGGYAYVGTWGGSGFNLNDWQVEYASVPRSADDPLDRNGDGSPDFNPASNRYDGRWDELKALRCDDPNITNWSTDLAVAGGDSVNLVRVVPKDPALTALESGQNIRLIVPLTTRENFNGGPYNGDSIPPGTVGAQFSTVRSDEWNQNWVGVNFRPSPRGGNGAGDRVTITRVLIGVTSSTENPPASAGSTVQTLAGNDVVWRLQADVNSSKPEGTTAESMTIQTVLNQYTTYNQNCTLNTPGAVAPNLVEYNTPNNGETRLVWTLGDVSSNNTIAPLLFCTGTDPLAPAGSLAGIATTANSSNALESPVSTQSIELGQTGEIQAVINLDSPIDARNDDQIHTLTWANLSRVVVVKPTRVINVFPFVGDDYSALSRTPASNFSGTLTLDAEPTVTFINGSVPGSGEPTIGTLSYTADAPATVNPDPDTNTSTWCTWNGSSFTAYLGSGVCPVALSDVTALRHDSNYSLEADGNPRQGISVRYSLTAANNDSGDIYTNSFAVDTDSLPAAQFIRTGSFSLYIASHSVGDLVFIDLNGDGRYTPADDALAPDGTPG